MSKSNIEQVDHLPTGYTNFLLKIYETTGICCDQVNIVLLLLLCSILGSIYRRIDNKWIRHCYGWIIGLIFLYFLYGKGFIIFIMFILAMYPLIQHLRNHTVVFVTSFGFLVSCMIYNYIYFSNVWRMDFTTSLMGMVIRVHMLVWDLIDGDDLRTQGGKHLGDHPSERKFRIEHACTQGVTFFEYWSYMFFFVHVICGSNLNIVDFLQLTDKTLYQKAGWRDPKKNPEPSWNVIIWGIAQIVVAAVSTEVAKAIFPTNYIFTQEFLSKPVVVKIFLLPATQWGLAFKYVFAWKCLDLAAITSSVAFSGVTYDERTGKVLSIEWERARNIEWLRHCFAQNTKDLVQGWNKTANMWFTRYLFQRINPPYFISKWFGGKASTNMLIIRILAALWHGVNPGIYLFYGLTFFFSEFTNSFQSVFPVYDDFEHKGVRAWAWRIFWTWICFQFMYTFLPFFIHTDLMKVVEVRNSIYWWDIPALLVLTGLGIVTKKVLGTKPTPVKATGKDKSKPQENIVEPPSKRNVQDGNKRISSNGTPRETERARKKEL